MSWDALPKIKKAIEVDKKSVQWERSALRHDQVEQFEWRRVVNHRRHSDGPTMLNASSYNRAPEARSLWYWSGYKALHLNSWNFSYNSVTNVTAIVGLILKWPLAVIIVTFVAERCLSNLQIATFYIDISSLQTILWHIPPKRFIEFLLLISYEIC